MNIHRKSGTIPIGKFQGRKSKSIPAYTLIPLYLLLLARFSWSNDPDLDRRLRSCVQNGGIVAADSGRLLYSHRGGEPFCPASTIKLATALMAFHELGASYRFKTAFYLRAAKDLIIRGYGDPFLVSEEWEIIVARLIETGRLPGELRDILLDSSSFSPDLRIPGVGNSLNPYDARNGALATNFNTVHVRVSKEGKISSAELQTPLTALAHRVAKDLPAGRHRINLSLDRDTALTYVGEIARAFLANAGYVFTGKIREGRAGPEDQLIYTHYNSRSLNDVIAAMMLYSSNYIANQLLLSAGLEKAGEPATLEKGLTIFRDFLFHKLGISGSDFLLVEGSGISRQNRITPLALLHVLRAFYPYRHLLTLDENTGALVKTGTLRGVYSMGGYLKVDRPLCFVIILNQKKNTRDKILSLLEEMWCKRLK